MARKNKQTDEKTKPAAAAASKREAPVETLPAEAMRRLERGEVVGVRREPRVVGVNASTGQAVLEEVEA
jgi:hypothetical protein